MLKQKTSKGGNIIKSIALIHTVKSAVSFDERLQSSIDEEVKIYNIWDDFLAVTLMKLENLLLIIETVCFLISECRISWSGHDCYYLFYVNSCSKMIRPFIKVPVEL